MVNVVKISQNIRKERLKRTNGKGQSAKLVITEQFDSNNNFEFYIGDIELFLLEFMKQMEDQLYESELDELFRIGSWSNLPGSFPADDQHIF